MPKPVSFLKNLYFFLSIVLFASCADKNNNKIQEALRNSLETSSEIIEMSSISTLNDLEEKKYNFVTQDRAEIWFAKAHLIKKFSEIRFDFIEKKKRKQKLNRNDIKEVFENLIEYKKEILGRDSTLREQFYNQFGFINKYKSLILVDTNSNSLSIQKGLSNQLITSILNGLQTEIRKIEYRTILFCNNRVGMLDESGLFESYSAIIGQNTNILKPGDIFEIKAGIGAFSKAAQPIITFNGKRIELNQEGYSLYKRVVPKKPGKYLVPVKINFFDQGVGKDVVLERIVEYTVIEPCNN